MSTESEEYSGPKPDLKHELRTYMTSIMGYIELVREAFELQAKAKGTKGEFTPDLENIWLAANLLAALVEDAEPVSGNGYDVDGSIGSESIARSPSEAGQRLRQFLYNG